MPASPPHPLPQTLTLGSLGFLQESNGFAKWALRREVLTGSVPEKLEEVAGQ